MANSDKNILITPNTSAATGTLPTIRFTGADNTPITMRVLDNGTLSFEATAGQLFSISDGLTGSIFAVNDISGIPSIEVLDTGTVRLAQYTGNVGIGIASPTSKLHVTGTVTATAFSGPLTGNASTATTLQTARNIGGTSFNGSADITPFRANTIPTIDGGTITSSGATYAARNASSTPQQLTQGLFWEFKNAAVVGGAGNYAGLLTLAPWISTTASTGDPTYQLAFSPAAANSTAVPTLQIRAGIDATWGSWATILNSGSTLTAGNLSGTIPSAVLGNSSLFIGTTSVALNRASAALTLAGITLSSGTLTGTLTAGGSAGTNGQYLQSTGTGVQWVTAALGYSAPTIGSTLISSGTTVTTIAGLTLTSPTLNTPTLTLATSSSTTDARMSWDTTNKKIQVGNGTAAIDFATSTLVGAGTSVTLTTNNYTLVIGDKDKLIEVNNTVATTLTVPLNSSVAYPIGSQITILQTGAGQVTITPTGGVTVNATPGLKLRTQWSSATLIKRATDTWVAVGDLSA
jgi:hypothetical protein